MPGTYIVKYSDNAVNAETTPPGGISVAPLEQNQDTSLTFVGYRSPVYGEALWSNMLHMLENFASPNPPENPIIGQIWVDTDESTTGVPKIFNNKKEWEVIAAGLTINSEPPPTDTGFPTDIWFNHVSNLLQWHNAEEDVVEFTDSSYVRSGANYTVTGSTFTISGTPPSIPFTNGLVVTVSKRAPNVVAPILDTITGIEYVVKNVTQNTFQLVAANGSTLTLPSGAETNQVSVQNAPLFSNQVIKAGWLGMNCTAYASQIEYNLLVDRITSNYVRSGANYAISGSTFTVSGTPPSVPFVNGLVVTITKLGSNSTPILDTITGIEYIVKNVTEYTFELTTAAGTTFTLPAGAEATTVSVQNAPPISRQKISTTSGSPNTYPTAAQWKLVFIDILSIVASIYNQNDKNGVSTPDNKYWADAKSLLEQAIATNEDFTWCPTNSLTSRGVATYSNIVDTAFSAFDRVAQWNSVVRISTVTIGSTASFVTPGDPTIDFWCNLTPIDSVATSWLWDFGNGVLSVDENPTDVPFPTPGEYDVILIATNSKGQSISAAKRIISYVTPTASFTRTPTFGATPFAVTFTDTSNSSPTSWLWNFGDGNTSTARSPVHTYTTAGSYTVTLTVSNPSGSNTIAINNCVVATTRPIASFTRTPAFGATPLAVTFTDTSLHAPTSWLWDFGDGNTSTARNPVHTYTVAGVFTVTLISTNSAGSSTAVIESCVLTTTRPIASFTYTPTSGLLPLAVAFTDTSAHVPTSWSWDFGNGATSTSRNPAYTYTIAGSYTVTLTATNAAGSSTVTSTVVAIQPIPVASFTRSPSSGVVPLTVSFVDTSTNLPTSRAWNFGDGNTSTATDPQHVYTVPGNYTVTLVASNSTGSGTATNPVTAIANVMTITVVSSIQNFNAYNNRISSQHGGAVVVSGTYSAGSIVNIVVNSGVVIGASTISGYAFDTGTGWDAANTLTLTNNGTIVGAGGNANGGPGGPALRAQRAITVTNSGTIGGGGGGGGAGGGGNFFTSFPSTKGAAPSEVTNRSVGGGGGGGAGSTQGAGGPIAGSGAGPQWAYYFGAANGSAGTTTAGGAGGTGSGGHATYVSPNTYIYGGAGGSGGGVGAPGGSGAPALWGGEGWGWGYASSNNWPMGSTYDNPAPTGGGSGGVCINGNGNISWAATGTRLGAIT